MSSNKLDGFPPSDAGAYKSPFTEGLEAASSGIAWTRCPYLKPNQNYERSEWLRGHSCKDLLK